ncbi:hypothetical protein GGR04_002475 [Aureimonas pseudogalii]|uniref:Uncharacterized protein n=1 Tax=Aureimonas pseudogalii TaxID=1744844 RepID=A0A7W6H4Y3_9HYPH|nr:hypothetical protein [Aureimonas pseudogalii]
MAAPKTDAAGARAGAADRKEGLAKHFTWEATSLRDRTVAWIVIASALVVVVG